MTTRDAKPRRKRPASARATDATDVANPGMPTASTRDRRLENECAQFLRVQQKLAGRKTTAEYARLRLVQRPQPSDARSLHYNGGANRTPRARHPASVDRLASEDDTVDVDDTSKGRPHTARADRAATTTTSATARVRPQSARPERRGSTSDLDPTAVAGQRVSVALLEKSIYNPIPLTTRLAASRSAPRLQAALQYATTNPRQGSGKQHDGIQSVVPSMETEGSGGRKRIVVNMRHLEIRELDEDSDGEKDGDDITVRKRTDTSAPAPLPGQRHERRGSEAAPAHGGAHTGTRAGRSAWGDGD